MTIAAVGAGEGAGVGLGDGEGVGEGLGVGDGLGVGEGLGVGVGVAVGEGEGVGVGVAVGVGVTVGVGEGVGEGVGLGEGVGVSVGVGVGEGVGVGVGVGVGAAQGLKGEAVLCGAEAAVWKSAALSPVSSQPSFCRSTEVVLFEGACAGPVPWKQLAVEPEPPNSTTDAPSGQAPLRVGVLLQRATLPAVELRETFPVASGVGKSEPQGAPEQPAPAPSCTRRYWPGAGP